MLLLQNTSWERESQKIITSRHCKLSKYQLRTTLKIGEWAPQFLPNITLHFQLHTFLGTHLQITPFDIRIAVHRMDTLPFMLTELKRWNDSSLGFSCVCVGKICSVFVEQQVSKKKKKTSWNYSFFSGFIYLLKSAFNGYVGSLFSLHILLFDKVLSPDPIRVVK